MKLRSLYGAAGTLFKSSDREIRILMYHRVTNSKKVKDPQITVTPESFDSQMSWLHKSKYQVISLDAAVDQINIGKIESPNQVVITFDDGFRDNYECAFPVLKKYKMPAIIYLIISEVDCNSEFLTLSQIKEMQEAGIQFGSHTITHPFLTQISLQSAWDEIEHSRIWLEKTLCVPAKSFAYPSGYFNKWHQAITKRSGYSSAVTIAPGGNNAGENPHLLKRTEISCKDSLRDFKNKLRGGFDWAHILTQKHQGLLPIPHEQVDQSEKRRAS
ncbi:MAG: polysaccharide deacetylase family protein [Proteobacteria bacterium]|nr:polysaccharide deacetylase family protein [Pseudomonadota bacterium]